MPKTESIERPGPDSFEVSVQQKTLEDYLTGESFEEPSEEFDSIQADSEQEKNLQEEVVTLSEMSISEDDTDSFQSNHQIQVAIQVEEPLLDESELLSSEYEESLNIGGESLQSLDETSSLTSDDAAQESSSSDEVISESISVDDVDANDNIDELADNLTNQIEESDTEPDPLDEFEGRVDKKPVGFRNGLIAVALLVLLVIGSVKFWKNRQTLAWDETWGGVTQSVCSWLPCAIQARRDVTKIRLKQRQVIPAKNQDDKLDVKLSLVNTADFAQPYPRITIKFSNSSGELLTEEQLSVKSYFPEKVDKLISSQTEVHISFMIDMPHIDAVGFEFSFD